MVFDLIGALSFFAASGRIGMESFRSRDRVPRPSSHGASARCFSRFLLKLSSSPVLDILVFKSLIAVQFQGLLYIKYNQQEQAMLFLPNLQVLSSYTPTRDQFEHFVTFIYASGENFRQFSVKGIFCCLQFLF